MRRDAARSLIELCVTNDETGGKAISRIRSRVTSDAFRMYPTLRSIFDACVELHDLHSPINYMSVAKHIEKDPAKLGRFQHMNHVVDTLTEMVHRSPHPKHLDWFCDQVNIEYSRTDITDALHKAQQKLEEDASAIPHEVIDDLLSKADDVTRNVSKPFAFFSDSMDRELSDMKKRNDPNFNESDLYVPLPFQSTKKYVRGFRYHTINILGARPGNGKTTFALNCAAHAADNMIKTLFISLEMDEAQLTQKILSMRSGIDLGKIILPTKMSTSEWGDVEDVVVS